MKILSTIKNWPNSKCIYALLISLAISTSSFACEICGCAINGYHFGILPQFKKNLFGVRYNYRSFQSQHLISEQLFIKGNTSTEFYNSVDIWGRFFVGKKIQLFAFVPFNQFVQNEEGIKTKASGLGDITIAANYTLYNDAANKEKLFKQTLLVGGGIKLPTGKFATVSGNEVLNPNMNTGTGSIDYLVNTIYNCRYKRVGLNADANYRINSTNNDEFQYGNRFTTSAKFFYWKDVGKKTTLLPNAGIMYEYAAKDKHYTEKQNFSGGDITYLTTGLEVYTGKINIGCTYNHPLAQNLSRGLVTNKDQVSVNVSYMF